MLLRKKVGALTLCAVLLSTSVVGGNAATKDSIIGANRYETAAKIADRMGNYDTAILVNSDKSLADGLSASSLAGKENAPILLVKKDSIPKETLSRLQKVKKVYIVGGTSAISGKVESQLSGKTIQRIEGKDRVDTSKKVANLVGNYDEAFVVNGFKGEADAMSVASIAARDKAPILLTKGTSSDHERKSGVKYYVVGGTAVVSNSVASKYSADRLGGSNRYTTNRLVVEKFYPNSNKLYYTKGDPLVDALTVSSLAKNDGVVLVSKNSDNTILKGKNTVQVGGMNFAVNPDRQEPVITTKYDKLTYVVGEKELTLADFGVKAIDIDGSDITDKVVANRDFTFSSAQTATIDLHVKGSNGKYAYKTITVEAVWDDDSSPEIPDVPVPSNINSAEFQKEAEQEFLSLINAHRVNNGKAPVRLHSELTELAFLWNKHMSDYNHFSHWYDDTETKMYVDRWDSSNRYGKTMSCNDIFPEVTPNIDAVLENIAWGSLTNCSTPKIAAQEYFNLWKNSSGHNRSMLDNTVTNIGFRVYYDIEDNQFYATLELGN